MTNRPILFQPPMVRALLDGRKTQTRRVLQGAWQAALEGHDHVKTWFSPPDIPRGGIPNQWAQSGIWAEKHGPRGYNRFLGYAPCRPGDRLWVREAWTASMTHGWTIADARSGMFEAKIMYRADDNAGEGLDGWWPSIHMPREFSRLTLVVTDVRVQRLQDISEEDAWAEGCIKGDLDDAGRFFPADEPDPSGTGWRGWDNARDWYADLWDSINTKRGFPWEANPWVAAYTFTVHRCNIDRMPAATALPSRA